MELKEFLELGFNKNEAVVYIALIKFRKANALQLIKETKFHKNIVYDNLEKLIDKGLVNYIVEGGRKIFAICSPLMLEKYFDEQEEEIEKKKKLAKQLADKIENSVKIRKVRQEAGVSRGVKGIKSFYESSLKKGEILSFGAPKESVDVMGEIFWENYALKRIANRVNARYIFNKSLTYWKRRAKDEFTKIKFFEETFEPLTETHIQGNEVAIIVWTQEPVLFLIENEIVSDSYKKFFEQMWKQASLGKT